MTCIHGLDELNCPTCRVIRTSVPLGGISLKRSNFLNANELVMKKKIDLDQKLIDEIKINKTIPHPPNLISKPKFINEIPNIRDKIFSERIKDLDNSREDNYGITKKIPLEKPEWKFEEED